MPIPNPVAFTIFHIDIMWYGILITAGIALATSHVCMRTCTEAWARMETGSSILLLSACRWRSWEHGCTM